MNRYKFARIGCYIILGRILEKIGLTFSDWEYYVIAGLALLLVLFTYMEYNHTTGK